VTTQRPGISGYQLSTAEIPFRVFPNIDGTPCKLCRSNVDFAHQPTYDLKSPIVLLRDEARTAAVHDGESPLPTTVASFRPAVRRSSTYSDKPIESSQEEFMSFVDRLLDSLGKTPLSATEPHANLSIPRTPSPSPRRERIRHLSCREAVEVALQKGMGPSTKSKVGVYEIGKAGSKVATLTIPRTMYKLGETIEGVLDLDGGQITCFQVPLIGDEVKFRSNPRWSRPRRLMPISAYDHRVQYIVLLAACMLRSQSGRHSP